MYTLLLVTSPPTSRSSYHALQLAKAMKELEQPFKVFFYQDSVSIANTTLWYAEDELNRTKAWQELNVPLPICVSAALQRGVSDQENASRHQLHHNNLAQGFHLTGLGTLADGIEHAKHIVQF